MNKEQQKIVLASGNQGKLREIKAIFENQPYQLIPQAEWNVSDADETGLTFVENALIKARHAAQHTGLMAMADDSGIEVDYLKGAPGIYSARYAGQPCDSQANNIKLLASLKDVPIELRTARFQCVIVLMRHAKDPTPLICSGSWEGTIIEKQSGVNGFGYDPLFFVPTHGCTSAELSPEIKNSLSHRGQALRHLAKKFPAFLNHM
ncbi:MAG: RdgB/HAM1 family non-canonical purine NTP pyrophosphatase [Gammaproteobacteria bacterium]|nr:RdgB/HAM1 family non-canonical purine NTP pyrophosphatase [Gammaproteobacteria bacterium]